MVPNRLATCHDAREISSTKARGLGFVLADRMPGGTSNWISHATLPWVLAVLWARQATVGAMQMAPGSGNGCRVHLIEPKGAQQEPDSTSFRAVTERRLIATVFLKSSNSKRIGSTKLVAEQLLEDLVNFL